VRKRNSLRDTDATPRMVVTERNILPDAIAKAICEADKQYWGRRDN
jgi:hypothetical protein